MFSIGRILASWRRFLPWLPRLVWAGVAVWMALLALSDRLPLVRSNHDVGHADAAAYALQARGLALDGSSRVPYVSVFFRRYDPGIWRYDDHWPPLLGWVLAPAFWWQGVDAAVGRAVCVGLGALFLPLVTGALAGAACRRMWAGTLAVALVLADPLVLQESTHILSDVLTAALVAAFAAATVAGRRNPRWYLLAGVCAAGATLAKGSQVILLGLLPAGALLFGGLRAWRERRLWGGVALGLVALMPWWTTVWRAYGNPLHSTQNYVSAFFGIEPEWDRGFYRVHWDSRLPTLMDRFQDRSAWKASVRSNTEVYLRAALLGSTARANEWGTLGGVGRWVQRELTSGGHFWMMRPRTASGPPPRPWQTAVGAVALVWGALALVAWPVERLLRWVWRLRRKRAGGIVGWEAPPAGLAVGAFLGLLTFVQAAFVILLWSAEQMRFTLAVLPLLIALAVQACIGIWVGLGSLLARAVRRWVRGRAAVCAAVSVALALAAGLVAQRHHGRLLRWQLAQTDLEVHTSAYYPRYHAVAQTLADAGVGDHAVVMSRNPWELLFYAPVGMRGVGLPYAEPAQIFAIARYYGVTHFVWDCERPGLGRFLRQRSAAFRAVAWRPFPVYAIDWAAFDAPQ